MTRPSALSALVSGRAHRPVVDAQKRVSCIHRVERRLRYLTHESLALSSCRESWLQAQASALWGATRRPMLAAVSDLAHLDSSLSTRAKRRVLPGRGMELGLPLARRPLCPRRTSKKRNQGSSPRLSRSICPRRRRLDAANSRQVGLFRCVGAYYLMRWEEASEGRLLTYSTNASKTCLRALLYTHSLSGRVSLIAWRQSV